MLLSAFNAIDSDGSGRIDYDEFWAALAPITNNLRDSDRKELFMKVRLPPSRGRASNVKV